MVIQFFFISLRGLQRTPLAVGVVGNRGDGNLRLHRADRAGAR
jgi:hypothetical protein